MGAAHPPMLTDQAHPSPAQEQYKERSCRRKEQGRGEVEERRRRGGEEEKEERRKGTHRSGCSVGCIVHGPTEVVMHAV